MEQAGIFDDLVSQPLAARLRPETIEEYVGQEHLLGRGRVLRRMIEQDRISSMIFWGPDHAGSNHCADDTIGIYQLFCCYQWHQRNPCRDGKSGEEPSDRTADHRICRRDPSLQ